MNSSLSKDGIFSPLTRFRWLPLSSKFRWRKWVSSQKVNINGDLLESEKENVSSLAGLQSVREHLAHGVAAFKADLEGIMGVKAV